MTGKLKAKGNLNLATKLDAFFTEVRKNEGASSSTSSKTEASKPAAASSGSVEVEGFKASQVFKQIDAWLNSLPEAERKKQVSQIKGLFQIDIKNSDKVQSWTLDLKNGSGEVYAGKAKSKADATLSLTDDVFVSMSQGKLTGQKAFMTGKLKVKGQMMLATKLDAVFKKLPSSKL
ncbi:sterol-binding-like protein [Neoconidiobolus thromboides FSU 785]|nr:sterol-binding-like protein [Neoconidiobolus thromboides FSU 785]